MKKQILIALSMFLMSACLAFGKIATEVEKSPLSKSYKIVKSDILVSSIDQVLPLEDLSPGIPQLVAWNSRLYFKTSAKFILRYKIEYFHKYHENRQKAVYNSNNIKSKNSIVYSRLMLPQKNM